MCDGTTDVQWGPLPGKQAGPITGDLAISVDFTSKGGPQDLKGVFNSTSNPPQIQWEDGNIWPKKG